MKTEEEQLIEGCVRRDQLACKRLYDRYASKMYPLCLRYSDNELAAQDILHDGFIKVFNNIHRLREPAALGSWIRSVMVMTAINNWHKEKQFVDVDTLDDTLESDYASYNEIYSDIDIHHILKAVQELPKSYRFAFNLCEIEGYDFPDAAEKLGVSESTVRSNLSRAKQLLAAKLRKRRIV